MSEIQRLPPVMNPNPVHPNAKSTTQITNGTTTSKSNIGSPVCRNCKTQTTPLWRRDETGQVLCNACGLFLKLHGRPRPISLKTDTIKSRNRIKQPNFSKSSGPNTPELKSKDSKAPSQVSGTNGTPAVPTNGRQSPLSIPRKRSPNGSPLEGIASANNGNVSGNSSGFAGMNSPLQPPQVRAAPFSGGVYPSHMAHFHGHGSAIPHQVQSLHYPSSTPTQFAPGLQRITSPLLLSTTPSVSNARSSTQNPAVTSPPSSLTAMQAAGALENMSNELGPSASFKNQQQQQQPTPLSASASASASSSSLSGVSLMGGSASTKIKTESPNTAVSLSTPSSALNSSPKPPSLPALGPAPESADKVLPSPSFGPQFALSEAHSKPKPIEHPMPALPPIHRHPGSATLTPQLPHLPSNLGTSSYSAAATPEHPSTPALAAASSQASPRVVSASSGAVNQASYGSGYAAYSGPSVNQAAAASGTSAGSASGAPGSGSGTGNSNQPNGRQDDRERGPPHNNNNNGNGNGNGNGNNNNNNSYEVNVLKTRISELELVNDLYRTRIMELEAMEQAARLRENSMRRRLDDLLRSQGYEESSSMLHNTMRVLKKEDENEISKRQKTG